jgi:hypothetical protein
MDSKHAEALKASLETLVHGLNVPMLLASECGDPYLKHLIGSLAADVIGKVDHEILPRLHKNFPHLKASGSDR